MSDFPFSYHTRYFVMWMQTYKVGDNLVDFKASSQFTFRDKNRALEYAAAVSKQNDVKDVEIKEKMMNEYPMAIMPRGFY